MGRDSCPVPRPGARDRAIIRLEAMLSRAEELEPGYRDKLWSNFRPKDLKLTDLSYCELGQLEAVVETDLIFLLED